MVVVYLVAIAILASTTLATSSYIHNTTTNTIWRIYIKLNIYQLYVSGRYDVCILGSEVDKNNKE
jgi:hypothetical protein